jgi:hypothetical protein
MECACSTGYNPDRGVVRDCADVAMRLGLSRARISQLLDLTLLAPESVPLGTG